MQIITLTNDSDGTGGKMNPNTENVNDIASAVKHSHDNKNTSTITDGIKHEAKIMGSNESHSETGEHEELILVFCIGVVVGIIGTHIIK
jgi:hypothetical protein